MHSFSINLSMSRFIRTNSARLAVSRPLRDFSPAALAEIEKKRIEGKDSTWKELLNMDARDTFLLAFWKRYGKWISEEMDRDPDASIKHHLRMRQLKILEKKQIAAQKQMFLTKG